ncbi:MULTISPECIES: DUF4352 domain-containing protein [Oscillatoriales]|uniref:DUF4352 domain-containing protein n=1 Tax=Limnospira TaxID=2596745 RepID=UPI0006816EF8|nr:MULTISPECIES: DUF4352 domain-containing protein [Oscillatoriales]MBD2710215.1 DUF4352 domain-containing protein [Arthrospira platensis FACHB-835]MDC0838794.1 DUF4352 domain-containing protein [Limnoraphis robusta]MDT9194580.1 DUF4352 domain-containing protein [Limnospira sp. PMC 1245.20]MBD2573178.1 DUF4352 domain-containing protein [Arthrospira platensis FACHB-971]MDT9179355.1 DUF4352 domain-containing protein [Limnospira sp. PMC 1238.20]
MILVHLKYGGVKHDGNLTAIFYVFIGIIALGIGLYLIISPFAFVIGLCKPSIVLNDKKPQTRMRVLKSSGITSIILVLVLNGLSSVTAEENDKTYMAKSSTFVAASTYRPEPQKSKPVAKPVPTETWINVRNDRAVKIAGIQMLDTIFPSNYFMENVESKGGQLAVVGLEMKNTGNQSGSITWSSYKLIDSQGRKYNEINDFSETLSINQWLKDKGIEPSSQLFPGQVVPIVKVFRVASDASGFKLEVNGKRIDIREDDLFAIY